MNNLPTWKQIEDNTLEHLSTARNAASDAALELRSDWSPPGTPLSDGAADRRDQVLKIVVQVKNLIDEAKGIIRDGRP